jgi:nicotinamidase-related amidase
MVIHVVVGLQLGYPEVSGQNSVFSSLKAAGLLATGDPAAEIYPKLTPQPGDVVVTKQRVGAFTETNLDMILRSNNIDTLLLAGILTRGVVLSTLRHAAGRRELRGRKAEGRMMSIHSALQIPGNSYIIRAHFRCGLLGTRASA